MRMCNLKLTAWATLFIGIAACFRVGAEGAADADHERLRNTLLDLLEAHPASSLLPELDSRPPAEWAATPSGAQMLADSKQAASVQGIPETTYTEYRRFKLAGERAPYEKPFHEKRSLLMREVMAAWFQQDFSRMDRINDLLWSICEESTWVSPAHEKQEWFIDLSAATTAVSLGRILLLMGDHVPDEIRVRVLAEVDRRIFTPYLAHAHEYGWDSGRNNWTGVCAGGVGQAFLMMEKDIKRQAEGLASVVEQLNRYIEFGFTADGGSPEGVGYWSYGLRLFVEFAEMLRARTGGGMDLLANPKMEAIARYPLAMLVGKDTYASFSDQDEREALTPHVCARLAERTGVTGLLSLTGPPSDMLDLIWWDGVRRDLPALEDAFLPDLGQARLCASTGPHGITVLAKAGDNAESHNHNDTGSFIVAVDDTIYLCDPGSGLYNRDYFSSARYDNVFANSYGHSVPRIGGLLQGTGKQYSGTIEKAGEKGVRIRFERSYAAPSLKEAERGLKIGDGVVTLEDTYAFDGDGLDVEEAFLTWQTVEVEGGVARITSDKGTLEIRAEHGAFTAERLEAACKANNKPGVLTRIAIAYPAEPKSVARFAMSFHAKN